MSAGGPKIIVTPARGGRSGPQMKHRTYPRRENELVELEVSEVGVDDVLDDLTHAAGVEQVDAERRTLRARHTIIIIIIIILILAFVVFNPGDLYYLGYK